MFNLPLLSACVVMVVVFGVGDVASQRFGIMPRPRPSTNPNNESIRYVLTFPTIVQRSRAFMFNLILFEDKNYSLPVTFTANLTLDGRSVAIQRFTQNKYGLQQHTFSNLSAANLSPNSYPNVAITFATAGLNNYTDISSGQSILAERFVFIQTDKAMYKPTHTVNFRVVILNRNMTPSAGVINVTLTDPKDQMMKTWVNVPLVKGTISGSYGLSDFVNLGDWKISIEGQNVPENSAKTFTVQQYVLPKYEVKMDFTQRDGNNYLLFNGDDESGYIGFVKAKYTFGKSVKGSADFKLTSTGGCSWSYDWPSAYTTRNATVVTGRARLLGDGSAEDGRFVITGLNEAVTFNPYGPVVVYDGSEANPVETASSPKLKLNMPQCNLQFNVTVVEDLTGEKISAEGSVVLYREPYAIKVHESVQKTLKPGLPFTMRFQVTKADGTPVGRGFSVSQQAYFFANDNIAGYSQVACGSSPSRDGEIPKPAQSATVETDDNGLVSIKADVPKGTTSSLFKARLVDTPSVELCENRSPPSSESKQFISIAIDKAITATTVIPKVNEALRFKIEASFKVPMAYFMIVQNGQPLMYTQIFPASSSEVSSIFSVNYTLPESAAPRVAAVVWTVENTTHEILADAVEFKVDGLIRQSISAAFSPSTVQPASNTLLNISTTDPNSMVALLAVDKSVRLLKSGNDITLDDVLGTVGEGSSGGRGGYRPVMPLLWRCWRCGWWPSWIDSSNAESVFSGAGMVIKSNARTGTPFYPFMMARIGGAADGGYPAPAMMSAGFRAQPNPSAPAAPDASPEPTVRMLFPETWLFNNTNTNAQGKLLMNLTAPDTITSWVLTAFTVGDRSGFGIMENPVELTVFQDFFVNLDIQQPTIIRGEQVQFKAVVFNYQAWPVTVNLQLERSDDFEVADSNGANFASRNLTRQVIVEANSGSSIPIWVKAKSLGTIKMKLTGRSSTFSDAMIKEVLVEPEGEVKYANKPLFIRLEANGRLTSTIDVTRMLGDVPDQSVVIGSRMFQLQAIGDILGPALSSLGAQIRLPTGCGEQTMVVFAPNVYIYKYLKSVGLLTDELTTKTTGFIDQGYQRELTYQRDDGGFSAFGNSDSASSTWLTAFVLRCFAAAKKHVGLEIANEPWTKAWNFMLKQQQPDGKFSEPGRVIHTSMKGGAASDVNLAAYVYTTLVEAGRDVAPYANLRNLIIREGNSTADAYTLALISYSLSIRTEDKRIGEAMFNRLVRMASRDGGMTYWKPANDQTGIDEYAQSGPTQIETSAYALLAYLNIKDRVEDDAIPIGRWLMAQRNSLGGFASTQDTVVGLQAISELAAVLRSNGQNFVIDAVLNFRSGSPISKSFSVSTNNALLLQSFDPPRDRQDLQSVALAIRGTGVGLVQLAMRYNVQDNRVLDSGDYVLIVDRDAVMARKRRSADAVEENVETELEDYDKEVALRACVAPNRNMSGMVLVEVGVPTGFEADLEGTRAANRINLRRSLKRIELGNRKVVFYFDALNVQSRTCVTAKLTRVLAVRDAKPPMVRVYSYYAPTQMTATEADFPGLSIDDRTACQNIRFKLECPP